MKLNEMGKCPAAALLLMAATSAAAAEPLENLRYALSGGTPNLDFRLRYESVDQNNALANAEALTARTRLGYTTGKWNQLDASVEYEGVVYIGDAQYDNNPAPTLGTPGFSVIPDAKGNELNQAWIRYGGIPGTVLKAGRQRIIFDNARFIGNVGWRQNEMTYDAYLVTNTSLAKTTFNYAFLSNANNIFFGDFRLHGHLLNAAYAAAPWLKLAGYGYLLDFDVNPAPGTPQQRVDTQTLGLRATGETEMGAGKLAYTIEYAQQSDYEDAPDTVDVDYTLLEVGYGVKAIGGKLGYEVLGSNEGLYGLQTPLATLHAHDGWADQFLTTPNTGLRNTYVSLNGAYQALSWLLRYHQWKADFGGADYGKELNLLAAYTINDAFSVTAKFADYQAETFSVDTKKSWLMSEYKF